MPELHHEGAAANSARSRSVITHANAPEPNASTVTDNPSGAISALSHSQNEVIATLQAKTLESIRAEMFLGGIILFDLFEVASKFAVGRAIL